MQCGGMEEVTRIYHDGREETTLRERTPRVEELRRALQRYLDTDPVSYTHLSLVLFQKLAALKPFALATSCLLYTSRCV